MKAQVLLPKVFNFPLLIIQKIKLKLAISRSSIWFKKRNRSSLKNNYLEPKNIKIKDIKRNRLLNK